MTEISNYIRKQKEILELLNSNKRHLINIEISKYLRRKRVIAYLLFVFTFPLPFYNCYIKRYYMAVIEFIYILLPLLVYYLFQDLYNENPTAKEVGTYYIAIAWVFFWMYDLFTIGPTVSQNAKDRKEKLYREEGILPVEEMVSEIQSPKQQETMKFWTPIIKKINSLVKRNNK